MLTSDRGFFSLVLASLIVSGAGCRRAPTPIRPSHRPVTVTLAAVGDVLLARGVGRRIAEQSANYPFARIRNVISGADVAFFNLECPLSRRGYPQRRRFLFRADPGLAGVLHDNGFDVASIANNHTLDYGRDAMMDTVDALRGAGIVPVGAGKDADDALTVKIVEKKGLRIGFVAFTDIPTFGVVRLSDRPTVAGLDRESLPDQIKRAKSRCDVLVVSFHWGVEYMRHPTERQKEIARIAIDSGADLVVGHHPHVLQTVEIYKDKPIIYSMGGFVWDPILPGTFKTAIYTFELGRSSARLTRTIPVRIRKCQPSPE
jgi:gamma-polyglutamate biosynthesis protein CapA